MTYNVFRGTLNYTQSINFTNWCSTGCPTNSVKALKAACLLHTNSTLLQLTNLQHNKRSVITKQLQKPKSITMTYWRKLTVCGFLAIADGSSAVLLATTQSELLFSLFWLLHASHTVTCGGLRRWWAGVIACTDHLTARVWRQTFPPTNGHDGRIWFHVIQCRVGQFWQCRSLVPCDGLFAFRLLRIEHLRSRRRPFLARVSVVHLLRTLFIHFHILGTRMTI